MIEENTHQYNLATRAIADKKAVIEAEKQSRERLIAEKDAEMQDIQAQLLQAQTHQAQLIQAQAEMQRAPSITNGPQSQSQSSRRGSLRSQSQSDEQKKQLYLDIEKLREEIILLEENAEKVAADRRSIRVLNDRASKETDFQMQKLQLRLKEEEKTIEALREKNGHLRQRMAEKLSSGLLPSTYRPIYTNIYCVY